MMPNASRWKTGADVVESIAGRVTSWLDRVPGYRGYRSKEDRRDADRAIRDRVAADLTARAERVGAVARGLATKRRLGDIGPVDELSRTIEHLANRVRTASYGYGGLFSNRDIDEAALDQLRRFDESLLESTAGLDPAVSDLENALTADGDLASAAARAKERVTLLHRRLDLRDRVVETGEPVDQASIAEVLALPTKPPAAAYEIGYRDAVAIMGDNFIVDARVDVLAGERSFRLFRMEAGDPERWLLVPLDETRGYALLSTVNEPSQSTENPLIDGVRFATIDSGGGEGELATSDRASGRRSVEFTLLRGAEDPSKRAVILDWPGERHVYAGTEVHPDDVEVFGSAGT